MRAYLVQLAAETAEKKEARHIPIWLISMGVVFGLSPFLAKEQRKKWPAIVRYGHLPLGLIAIALGIYLWIAFDWSDKK